MTRYFFFPLLFLSYIYNYTFLEKKTMAEAFLGLKVSVLLQSGVKLEGTVSHIEPTTQQMTLKDGKSLFGG